MGGGLCIPVSQVLILICLAVVCRFSSCQKFAVGNYKSNCHFVDLCSCGATRLYLVHHLPGSRIKLQVQVVLCMLCYEMQLCRYIEWGCNYIPQTLIPHYFLSV